jgi:hypothetical protein
MNSDRNTLECSKNFPYTPVFLFFKSNFKSNPYVYRQERFTPQLLRNFIDITASSNVLE